MATSASRNFKLGLFVTVGLLVLIGFVYYIGSNQSLFGSTIRVRSIFKNISGLQAGAVVRYAGISSGTVESIRIVSDTTVEVAFIVDTKIAEHVKKDSRVSIGSDGIMGDKVVNLMAGSIDAPGIRTNDLLASEEPLEMDAIIERARDMAVSLNTITTNVADITSAIRNGQGTIGMLLYDQKMANKTRGLMGGLDNTLGSVNRNLKNLEGGTESFSENMKAVQSNVLLRGYFKKKEKAAQKSVEAKNDSIENLDKAQKKLKKKEERAERKKLRKAKRNSTTEVDTSAKG